MSDGLTDLYIGVTCTLADATEVVFDVPYSEADDHDETYLAYEMMQAAAGA
jgi:hypothetical protein